jgi:hypothetical protein
MLGVLGFEEYVARLEMRHPRLDVVETFKALTGPVLQGPAAPPQAAGASPDSDGDDGGFPASFHPDDTQEVAADNTFAGPDAEFSFAGKDTLHMRADQKRGRKKALRVDFRKTDIGRFLVVDTVYDPTAIAPIDLLEIVRRNMCPSDESTWAENNGQPWDFFAVWHSLTGPDDDGACRNVEATFTPYLVPKELADRFANGTQPEDAFDFRARTWKGPKKKCIQFFSEKGIGPFLLKGQVALTKEKKLPKPTLATLHDVKPSLREDFNRRYAKLLALEAQQKKREAEAAEAAEGGSALAVYQPVDGRLLRPTVFKATVSDASESARESDGGTEILSPPPKRKPTLLPQAASAAPKPKLASTGEASRRKAAAGKGGASSSSAAPRK